MSRRRKNKYVFLKVIVFIISAVLLYGFLFPDDFQRRVTVLGRGVQLLLWSFMGIAFILGTVVFLYFKGKKSNL